MPSAVYLAAGVFVFTYVGMAAGRIPGLRVDRTGIALMAVAALLAGGAETIGRAMAAIDGPTIVLMFGLMILSAQFARAGAYDVCAARLVAAAPLAARATKEVAVRTRTMSTVEAIRFGETMRKVAAATEDAAEGARAAREGRPPVWKGR